MNREPGPNRDFPGYLAAFTLGMICLGVIVLVVRHETPQSDQEPTAVPDHMPVNPRKQSQPAFAPRPGRELYQTSPAEEVSSAPANSGQTQVNEADSTGRQVERVPIVNSVVQPVVVAPKARSSGTSGLANTRISGRVTLSGKAPPEKVLPLDARCAAKHQIPPTTRLYVTGKDSGLADVVVSLKYSKRIGLFQNEALLLRQQGCLYEPYITAVQAGQTIHVQNTDDVLHNIDVQSSTNGSVNRAQLPGANKTEIIFKRAEDFIRFRCDVHPWEFAYVSVFEHPFFAVTDKNGSFEIPNVPPGEYELEARHRKAGVKIQRVRVEKNRGVTANFDFEAPAGADIN